MASNVRFERIRFEATGQVQFLDTHIADADGKDLSEWSWIDCTFDGVPVVCVATKHVLPDGTVVLTGSDIVRNVQFERCRFLDVKASSTVEFVGCSYVRISNCTFERCGISRDAGDAIKVAGGSRHVSVTGCNIYQPKRDGIDVFDSLDSVFMGNTVVEAGAFGYEAKWGSLNAPAVVQRHKVIGNHFEDCDTGCSVSANYCTCQGNIAVNCKTGFRVNPAMEGERTEFVNMAGNTAVDCERGFWLAGDRCAFTGNLSHNAKRYGAVVYGRDCELSGNIMHGSGVQDWLIKPHALEPQPSANE